MSLLMRIIKNRTLELDRVPVLDFEIHDRACLIGRSRYCDWKLPDPERALSSVHCFIQYHEDEYYLIDNSLNGVFITKSGQEIGKGRGKLILDGDIFTIGDYEIESVLTATYTHARQSKKDEGITESADETIMDMISHPHDRGRASKEQERELSRLQKSVKLKDQQIALLSEAITSFALRKDVGVIEKEKEKLKETLTSLLMDLGR